jgi:hypothetical protein
VPRAGYPFSAGVVRRDTGAESLPMKWPIGVLPARPEVSELIGLRVGHKSGRSFIRARHWLNRGSARKLSHTGDTAR